ncbi:putative dynamin family protein [Neofusicoccum parvum UCRNP2]|uniref:Putative dynamin family protein n=1 Tax=Botryosphaeria parva (strain UCR-NP2) TaxID=1287680 RepID=R1GS22_BOTPV|nr:putative dynamin family protein [Neofusicoccum parvum UCRNP2]
MPATITLEALQSEDMRNLLNVVDELRHEGLNGILSLPQLVVCGDQPSGKSSVLEAITQIDFPRNANMCTRFATEIVLRREPNECITAKILPDGNQPASRLERLQNFNKSIGDFSKLGELISDATKLMEAPDPRNPTRLRAFFTGVLSITVSGPTVSPLTLVDIPGLIHSENRQQTQQDVDFIRNLVNKYIQNPRSIILAVVSARHDYANQIILQDSRRVDPHGSRTLGIITKPDCLDEGSEEERSWIALAQNKDIKFELGWHVLRNRTQAETSATHEERDDTEKLFFTRPTYRLVDKNILGISALRERLSRLLFAHLKQEIPKLGKELNDELANVLMELSALGHKRATVREMREFLTRASMKFHELLQDGITGNYKDPFFLDAACEATPSANKLRAAIQYDNSRYSEYMHLYGGKFQFDGIPTEVQDLLGDKVEPSYEDPQWKSIKEETIKFDRGDAVAWVRKKMQHSRGQELPGCFSPSLLHMLYWEQTSRWGNISSFYVEEYAHSIVHAFVRAIVQHVMPKDAADRVWEEILEPSLTSLLENALAELDSIIADTRRAPMTYNNYYTDLVQQIRNAKRLANLRSIVESRSFPYNNKKVVDVNTLVDTFKHDVPEPDMDTFTSEDALDCLLALYKDKLKNYIADVTEKVVERHLVQPLLGSTIDPASLCNFTDEQVRDIASEPEHVTRKREQLESIKAGLEKGQKAFRRAIKAFG